jgi:serine/threonine-protein kinase
MSGEVDQAPDSDAPRALGRLLADRYRILSVLGEGGMAIVYEGEHVAIGKRVAIKLVQSLFAKDAEIVQRFEHEARSASAVESEHIVHVFDAGADPELGLFLVMELLKGEDLARYLAREGKLDPLFACGLVDQAALGLEKAHAAGVVHRDLKPANMFLVERDDGSTLVKVVDFGIAKVVRDVHDARFARKGITRRGTAVGTPQYMSPEQAQALDTVDHRTDVYSLGAVLFEAIAGQPHLPERPTYEQTILQIVSTPAPRLSTFVPDVPSALDDLLAEMLQREVANRVPDMRAVRDRLHAIYPQLRGARMKLKSLRPPAQETAAHRAATLPGTSSPVVLPRRGRSVIAVAGLAAILGTGLGMTAMWRGTDQANAKTPRSALPAPSAHPSSEAPITSALPSAPPGSSESAGTAGSAQAPAAASTPAPVQASVPRAAATAGLTAAGTKRVAPPTAATVHSPKDQVGAAGISSQF